MDADPDNSVESEFPKISNPVNVISIRNISFSDFLLQRSTKNH